MCIRDRSRLGRDGSRRVRRGIRCGSLGEGKAGQEKEREEEGQSHTLSPYFNHPDEKINQRTEHRRENHQEQPQDFLGRILLARGAFVDHPDPEQNAEEFQASGAFEEIGQRERHLN